MKQKHKKQPFGDVSASHLSLVVWLISSQGLNQPHHITNAALLRGLWHRQKDKNSSPSAKNQSSEIRLSENANKKRPECVMRAGIR
ncbi:MAG: hypothetical protein L6U16_08910 [Porphyromonadaceae bacterium]|nr:MAG: hypothetical protein L6U16_08910 [Porphyromonadaceae bacterium]